jgi:hypothetical protein
MRTLLNRLRRLEASVHDGDCRCPSPPSPAPPPDIAVVEHRVVSPPLRLRCPDCRQMRDVEFAVAILASAGPGEGGALSLRTVACLC